MYHCLKLLHPTLHLLKCVLVSDIVDLHPCWLSAKVLMHYAALYRDILCRVQRRLRGHIIEGSGLLLSEGPSQGAFSSRGYHSVWSAWRIEAEPHTWRRSSICRTGWHGCASAAPPLAATCHWLLSHVEQLKMKRGRSSHSPAGLHQRPCSTRAPGCGSAPALLCPRKPPRPAL